MDHGYFKDRISGYLDGELRDYEMEAVRRHLEECAECRGIYEDLGKLDLLVERHSGLDGDDYWEAQAQKIEQRLGVGAGPEVTDIAGRRGWGFGWKLAAVAASVGVLTFIGLHQTDILKQDKGSEQVTTLKAPSVADTGRTVSAAADERDMARDAVDTPEERQPESVSREGSGEQGADREPAGETAAKEAETTVDAELKRESSELDKTISVQPERETSSASPGPRATAPLQEEVARKPLSDIQAYSDETAERYHAAEREESLQQQAPSRLSPSLNLSLPGGSSTLARASALSPAARIVTGTLTAPEPLDQLTLADWIDRSDSLQTVWNDLNRGRATLTLPSKKGKSGFSDLHLVERQLIEAQFNVGRMAADENQAALDEAVGFLRRYIERPDARYRSTARMYLDQLQPNGSGD